MRGTENKQGFSQETLPKRRSGIQDLLHLSSGGSDDELSALADEIHPRSVRKIVSFLELMHRNDAWCAIHFGGNKFQFRDAGQVKRSANRLGKNNVHESEESIRGRFQGILPQKLMFELRRLDDDFVISGKIGREAGDSASLRRLPVGKPVVVRVTKVRVGRGEPRYTLRSVEYEKVDRFFDDRFPWKSEHDYFTAFAVPTGGRAVPAGRLCLRAVRCPG